MIALVSSENYSLNELGNFEATSIMQKFAAAEFGHKCSIGISRPWEYLLASFGWHIDIKALIMVFASHNIPCVLAQDIIPFCDN